MAAKTCPVCGCLAGKVPGEKVGTCNHRERPEDPYVFVEWREAGQYHGANYRRSYMACLLATIRIRGVETVYVDDVETPTAED